MMMIKFYLAIIISILSLNAVQPKRSGFEKQVQFQQEQSRPNSQQITDEEFSQILAQLSELKSQKSLTDQQFSWLENVMLQSPIEQCTQEQIDQLKKVLFQIPWQQVLNKQQLAQIQKILPKILPKLLNSKAAPSQLNKKEFLTHKPEPLTNQKINNQKFSQILSQISQLGTKQNLTDQQFDWLQDYMLNFPVEQLNPDQLYNLGKAFYQLPLEKILTLQQFSQIKNVLAQILLKQKVNQFTINRNQTKKFQTKQQQTISDYQFTQFLSQMSQLGMFRSLTEQQFMWLQNYMLQFPVEQLTPQQLDQFRATFYQLPLKRILNRQQFSQIQNLLSQISFKLRKSESTESSSFTDEISDEQFAQILSMISQVGTQKRLTDQQFNILLNEISNFPFQEFSFQILNLLKSKIEQMHLNQILTPEQTAKIQIALAPILEKNQDSQFQVKRSFS